MGVNLLLIIENIRFGFAGAAPLVVGLSFQVKSGEITLVQGASGCGKSTLLGVISGTAPAQLNWQGDVSLNGRSLSALPAEQRRVGILFQDPLLFPHMSVGDNLAFGLETNIRGSARLTEVKAALDQAGMADFGDRDPASLSGGQAARIGLMRSLLAAPEALLLDEPFAALDQDLVAQFGGFVQTQIRARNIPAIMVSHDASHGAFATGAPIHL